MKTLQSRENPDYSVTIYSHSQYGGGNGYYFHLTDNKDTAYSMNEMRDKGQNNVITELKLAAEAIWKS